LIFLIARFSDLAADFIIKPGNFTLQTFLCLEQLPEIKSYKTVMVKQNTNHHILQKLFDE
jgi:hypothetical protein